MLVDFCRPLFSAVTIAPAAYADSDAVVKEIDVNKTSQKGKAAEAWDKTKEATSAAATATVEFTKEHGTRAVNATKRGVKKGTEVVVVQSKRAWNATKNATGKAVDATVDAVSKAGKAISNKMGDDSRPPVTDHSTSQENANGS